MPAMSSNTTVAITVGSNNGHPVSFGLNRRIRERCPQLGALPPGAMLPNVDDKVFHVVIAYLDGDESLTVFTSHTDDDAFLIIFAQAWVLAARLCLPLLQNKLVSVMMELHTSIIAGGGKHCAADDHLLNAFQHLREQLGKGSHAEAFLICFIGRTAPLICQLERQLTAKNFDRDIKEKILAEARSFEGDPIKHHPHLFLGHPSSLLRYPPLGVHTPAPASSSPDDDVQQPSSYGERSVDGEPAGQPSTVGNPNDVLRYSPPENIGYSNSRSIAYGGNMYTAGSSPDRPPLLGTDCRQGRRMPYIQTLQHNANANDNGNNIRNSNVPRESRSRGRRYVKFIREKKAKDKGKRYSSFSLLTCESHHY
jgi:hypothetical protein